MSDKYEQAMRVFEDMCSLCDEMEIKYERHEDKMYINFTVVGDDLPMRMFLFINPEREMIRLLSPMPFSVPEDKMAEMAMAVCAANLTLMDGSFDYILEEGNIDFRLTASYIDSIIGKELFRYMIAVSANNADRYNDKFLMLSKGVITLEQFVESIQKK